MQTEYASAKINLYLNVVGKRPNGYHDLVSLMQTVSLCDVLTVDFEPAEETEITLRASGNDQMPTDRRNLAWKAAEAFLNQAGLAGKVSICIEKHIPMAAGLAGGSADAAAVLRGLNRLCGSPLSTEVLCQLGAQLGADVPFCIVGGTALVTGIGDNLAAISCMPKTPLVVACMGEGVSTPWAYGALDERNNSFENLLKEDPQAEKMLQALDAQDISAISAQCFNLFETVVPPVQPYVDILKQTMTQHGAIRSMMSGSGPSVFGIFKDEKDAQAACNTLKEMGAAAAACYPCTPSDA